MADEKKSDFKKGFSNNFVLFLIAAILAVLMIQNFLETKVAKVSFSYQLEPLVNLDLIQSDESRKTAVNDNLVTFSGKFYDRLQEDSKIRYKYLQLLDNNHQFVQEKAQIEDQLKNLRKKIESSAEFFLSITGIPLPPESYTVVENLDNGIEKAIVITKSPKKNEPNLLQVQGLLGEAKSTLNENSIKNIGQSLVDLVGYFRSPLLGIGNEGIKQNLREIERSLSVAAQSDANAASKLETYEKNFDKLQAIAQDLNKVEDRVRLNKLRSVRNYKQIVNEYAQLASQLDDNQMQLDKSRLAVSQVIWFFNNQEISTRMLEKQDSEVYHHWFLTAKEEWQDFEKNRGGYFKAPDQPLNAVLERTFRSEEPPPKYLNYVFPAMLALAVIIVLYVLFARQMKGVGSSAMSFGKSPAKLVLPSGPNRVTFKDVAGVDEALEELQEIVEFLKNPQKFTTLGGRIPKGVLCVGPPGTGKTLVAKAVAGEADRPFFSISGSDFVEMFVGVGASRIRDLFDQAKKNAPCIIFIDEIDAVGRHRGAGIGGGHDEREQTLNQLLVEMDGFDTQAGVILMASTNRPDILDKALLRPGRFDRRVVFGLPDIKGRFEILKVHARKIKMDLAVDLMALARSTPGCSGADLANMLNEAALLAARRNRTAVTMPEVMEARDKVLYGKERRSLEMDEQEKKTTAYHESGHTIVGLVVKHGDPIDKVTIIPRGLSLGATMFLPKKNRVSYWKKELHDQLAVLMGGRAAEEVFLGDISSGAKQDIERATQLARSMVCEWGMSEKLGAVSYDEHTESGQYGMGGHYDKKYSEETAKAIDIEVRQILDVAYGLAKKIIMDCREKVELLTQMLIEFETLDNIDIQKILEGSWDINEKRARLKTAQELNIRPESVPPPPPAFDDKSPSPLPST